MAASVRLAPLQIAYLNLIRGSAAQIVLIGHASGYCLAGLEQNGHIETFGVLIFFLLSGFLITSSAFQKLQQPDYGYRHFVIERFCRIFCAYVPALLLVAAVDATVQALPAYAFHASDSPLTWIGNLLMLQEHPIFQILRRLGVGEQPWFIETFGSGRPFWTVAVEWWIYLGFGYLVFCVIRRRRLGLREIAALSVLGIVPLYNAMAGVGHCLTFVWALGAAAALLRHPLSALSRLATRGHARRCWAAVTLISLLALCGHVLATGLQVYELQFATLTGFVLFSVFFLLGTYRQPAPGLLTWAFDRLAGYSYSLYLTHYTILTWFKLRVPSATHWDPALFAVLFATANAVALGFWFLFERHYPALTRRAKRVFDRRGPLQPVRA